MVLLNEFESLCCQNLADATHPIALTGQILLRGE
ncbi:hypothetical protein FVER14953_21033 [Fusarium verticillioides]|nr:hypothetical protein FVER14953_21033 [Fusarium verticillioides]